MYEYNAIITNIVDGDTYDLDIDLGFHIHIHERVRVLDLDTPEKRGEEKELGYFVTQYAIQHFLNQKCIIHSKEELTPTTDSFGRWLVEIIIKGESVADLLTSLGVNKYNKSNYNPKNCYLLTKKEN